MNPAFVALAVGAALTLGACATTPPTTPFRLADMPFPDTGQSAFVWTSGGRKFAPLTLHDAATITRIDGAKTPADFLPVAGSPPYYAWLLEVPAGSHEVEILYKEENPVLNFFTWATMYTEVRRQTITWSAEPNRTYAPFVGDDCGREWFWMEDWGAYVAGMETRMDAGFEFELISDLAKPVAAGEAPPKECKQSN